MSFGFAVTLDSFKAARTDLAATVEIALHFQGWEPPTGDFRDFGNRAHHVGWTIRIRRPAQPHLFGAFHVHKVWFHDDRPPRPRFWAHFKRSHRSARWEHNKLGSNLTQDEAALLYNQFQLARPVWDERAWTRPEGAPTGWTPLRKRVTQAGVAGLIARGDLARLRQLARNDLYPQEDWEPDAWNAYLSWQLVV